MYYDLIETGKRIKQIRKNEKLTQEQMAERLCISLEHYGKLESGKRGCSIDVLVSIATEWLSNHMSAHSEKEQDTSSPMPSDRASAYALAFALTSFWVLV